MNGEASLEEIATKIIGSGSVEIRNVDGGEDPFNYSSGNRGPGYIMIKGLVGQPNVLKFLTKQLAYKVVSVVGNEGFDFIEGNVTGGMIPGWQLSCDISEILGREIPFCYLRESRKEGGHGELITGDRNNPLIKIGMRVLVVEELVNYAETTTNAAEVFRKVGYPVSHAACILSYDHADSNRKLKEKGVTLIPLITLPQLLDVAEATGQISRAAVQSYRDFLADTIEWQLSRGFVIPADLARKAIDRGYKMKELNPEEAIKLGAPKDKVNSGFMYLAREG